MKIGPIYLVDLWIALLSLIILKVVTQPLLPNLAAEANRALRYPKSSLSMWLAKRA